MGALDPARPVLVTGGAGFIGSHLVARLLADGESVVVLDDLSGGEPSRLPPDVPLIEADIADPATADAIAAVRPRAIIHAAAQISVPHSMVDPARDREVNLIGTQHVIAGARAAGNARVVFLSSGGGIYGETPVPATEDTLPRPKSYYSVHKYAAEQYLELSGLPYAIARLANVYGPRQRAGTEGAVAAIFAERLQGGLPITIHGDGEQRRDFVHVADVAAALTTLLRTPQSGVWNVGSGRAVTINALLAAAERAFGPAVSIHHAPARPGDVITSTLDVAKIARDLGWRAQIELEEGIRTLRESNGEHGAAC
ncbi:MAG: NAD-dependent epimerase/dehydratase family protein [Thermomicrobiales bacterium]